MNIKNIKILLLIGMYISVSYGVDKIKKDKGKMSSFFYQFHLVTCDELSQRIGTTKTDKGKKKKDFMCLYPGCGKLFTCQSKFNIHMRVHTGEKIYECNLCNKKFTRRSGLLYHSKNQVCTTNRVREKKEKKDFICSYLGCGKIFRRQSQLNEHMRVHTGEKPHVCKYEGCTYSSAQKSNLDTHERTHTGEKPYECNLCNRKFADHSGLEYHTKNRVCEKKKK
jgi:uncharacterized Zn-finger protein